MDEEMVLEALLSRAIRLYGEGDCDQAIAILEGQLRDHPGTTATNVSVRAHMRLASFYRSQGRLADEADLLERFMLRFPDDRQRTRADARLSKVYARMTTSRQSEPLQMSATWGQPRPSTRKTVDADQEAAR